MYLLELSLYEFRQFIQIVLWISVPLVIVSVSVTTFLHYRRKKKKAQDALPGTEYELTKLNPVQPLPSISSKASENDTLIKQYEQQLRQSRDKYHTLERSFRRLQENYSSILSGAKDEANNTEELQDLTEKIKTYELKIEQLQQALEYLENNANNNTTNTGTGLIKEKEEQLKQLESRIKELTESLTGQANENERLRRDLLSSTSPAIESGEHLQQLKEALSNAEEEKSLLKHRVADLSCYEEITKEKNLQIEFLQNQLEQRIKHNHSLEQQEHATSEINGQLQLAMEETKKQALELEENIQSKQHEIETIQSQLNEHVHKNEQLHLSIQLKANEITQFTSQLSELRYENTSLHESEEDSNRQVIQLKEELAEAKIQAKEFEDKWEHNSRLISRIYRELSGSVENEMSVNGTGVISGMRKDHEVLSDIV